ncbi:MAG: hypothetical protein ACFHWZ_16165 [Phycisphaerales bacterium]
MLKFLRKYNTLILVVGGSLLMVVFLVPQAIEQIGATRRISRTRRSKAKPSRSRTFLMSSASGR